MNGSLELEPALKPLAGKQLAETANSSKSARVDIKAGGFFFGGGEREQA